MYFLYFIVKCMLIKFSLFFFGNIFCGLEKDHFTLINASQMSIIYFDEVYLVTAFVPSLTACLANSPGNKRRTAVWISRLVMVERLL